MFWGAEAEEAGGGDCVRAEQLHNRPTCYVYGASRASALAAAKTAWGYSPIKFEPLIAVQPITSYHKTWAAGARDKEIP